MESLDLGPVWLSLQLATVTVAVLLVIGTPLAWWLAFTRSRFKPGIEALVALPLVLPPTVLGFYLLILLGPAGAIGRFWVQLTDTALTFSFSGLVVASVIYSFPFAVQPLQNAFEGVGRAPPEAVYRNPRYIYQYLEQNRWIPFSASPPPWRSGATSPQLFLDLPTP